ncbi:MAG: acid phosphatase [Planctomycetota bacterium]
MRRCSLAASLLLAAALTGCTSDRAAVAPAAAPRDAHEGLDATLWMQTSAEYQMLCRAAYRGAAASLDRALGDPTWTASLEQTTVSDGMPPAIIVDVDETVLDNSPFQGRVVRERTRFSPQLWQQWVSQASAPALPGAVEFLRDAAQRGVAVFYVTNRSAASEDATRRNLAALGFPLASSTDVVLTEGENGWTSDKTARRVLIASKYRVLLLIGDDLGDFLSGAKDTPENRRAAAEKHAERFGVNWILLPNPAYGSWERALYPPKSADDEALARKFARIRAF